MLHRNKFPIWFSVQPKKLFNRTPKFRRIIKCTSLWRKVLKWSTLGWSTRPVRKPCVSDSKTFMSEHKVNFGALHHNIYEYDSPKVMPTEASNAKLDFSSIYTTSNSAERFLRTQVSTENVRDSSDPL